MFARILTAIQVKKVPSFVSGECDVSYQYLNSQNKHKKILRLFAPRANPAWAKEKQRGSAKMRVNLWVRVRTSVSACWWLCVSRGNNNIAQRSRNWYWKCRKRNKTKCEAKIRYLLSMDRLRRLPHSHTHTPTSTHCVRLCLRMLHSHSLLHVCMNRLLNNDQYPESIWVCLCTHMKATETEKKSKRMRLNVWWRPKCCVFSSTFLFSFLLATFGFFFFHFFLALVPFRPSACRVLLICRCIDCDACIRLSACLFVWVSRVSVIVVLCIDVRAQLIRIMYFSFVSFSTVFGIVFSYMIRWPNLWRTKWEKNMYKIRNEIFAPADVDVFVGWLFS